MQILVGFNVDEPEDYYDSKTKLSIIFLNLTLNSLNSVKTFRENSIDNPEWSIYSNVLNSVKNQLVTSIKLYSFFQIR